MSRYRVVKSTGNVLTGREFECDSLCMEQLSLLLNCDVGEIKITKIEEGLFMSNNEHFILIFKEVN